MAYDTMGVVILGIICGVLAAIVYSLRILVLMERRIARMDAHIEVITRRIAREEFKIEKQEEAIMAALKKDIAARKKPAKKSVKKKATSKKK